jgi:hypothetical protein
MPPAIAVGNGRQVLAEQHHRHQHAAPGPVLRPITSGLPSGLRISDWKIAPLTPSARHQNGHRHARQSPFGDHHGDVARRMPSSA